MAAAILIIACPSGKSNVRTTYWPVVTYALSNRPPGFSAIVLTDATPVSSLNVACNMKYGLDNGACRNGEGM